MATTKSLFKANDGTHGYELWVTDGTAAGTSLLVDIFSGAGDSSPSGFAALNSTKLLFSANDGIHGYELWVSDGTSAGTSMVLDINSGAGNSRPAYITSLGNGTAVFSANDGVHGYELWISDGTAAGTSLVKDIYASGSVDSLPQYLTSLGNGKVVFSANDGASHGFELWVTDGTGAGTSLVKDINPGGNSSNLSDFVVLGNGTAVFRASDGNGVGFHGYELWVTDGTTAGTSMVLDIRTGTAGSVPQQIAAIGGGKALFEANDGTHGYELWITDGTTAGTSLLKDINPGTSGSLGSGLAAPSFALLGNGQIVFAADDGSHGGELWVTDGTSANTSLLKDINSGATASFPQYLTALGNGKAVFSANDGSHGYELWVTDGTGAGTSLLVDINPGANSSLPVNLKAVGNGQALFSASDGTHGSELWVTDGTAAGTSLVKDINSGGSTSGSIGFAPIPCFCRGTLVRTEAGERPVEELAIGDRVLTLSGEARPIRWIGKRAYDGRFITGNRAVLPICVTAGALGDGVPMRDLFVSPEHALYVDGCFVPAGHLTNGVTIRQVDEVDRLEYFHLELDAHEIIFAEGATAETFADFGGRGIFQNSEEFALLYPDKAPADWEAYAVLLAEGRASLPAIRARLLARAASLGRVENGPDLHLLVDGRIVRPQSLEGRIHRFAVPHGARQVTIASRSEIPSETEAASLDPRRLGVPLERIVLWGGGLRIEIGQDHAGLCDGFHADEGSHRWTDGRGVLPSQAVACFAGEFTVEVQIGRTELHYPVEAPPEAATAETSVSVDAAPPPVRRKRRR